MPNNLDIPNKFTKLNKLEMDTIERIHHNKSSQQEILSYFFQNSTSDDKKFVASLLLESIKDDSMAKFEAFREAFLKPIYHRYQELLELRKNAQYIRYQKVLDRIGHHDKMRP